MDNNQIKYMVTPKVMTFGSVHSHPFIWLRNFTLQLHRLHQLYFGSDAGQYDYRTRDGAMPPRVWL